jgi:ABC-2 type transport system permease protein
MRNIWVIASRELRHYFISPVAYTVATMLFLILGGIFFINIYFGMQGGEITPDGRMVVGPLVTILLFATPALTMRLVADEYRMGTMELMLTAPVRDAELIIGKWLGVFEFMLVLLLVTLIYPLILHRMTVPGIDQGVLVATYIGLALMSAALLAVGVLISALFKNPLAAFFVTLAVLLLLWIASGMASGTGVGSEIARHLSIVDHFYDTFYRGIISLTDVTYFVGLTAIALFLGTQVVQARRWS